MTFYILEYKIKPLMCSFFALIKHKTLVNNPPKIIMKNRDKMREKEVDQSIKYRLDLLYLVC